MGLDMFAYRTAGRKIEKPVDFRSDENDEQIHYWRKHPDLHGWMESLYREKGGTVDNFNCANVQLAEEDLNHLESDLKDGLLPETVGFFFGSSQGREIDDDLEFIKSARQAIAEGDDVYYTSWW